jgi:hypothetical protein
MLWVWWPQVSSALDLMPDLRLDPRLVNYTLEHGYLWWSGDPLHAQFWHIPLFYPQLHVTAYTDVMIGVGPLYWVWREFGAAPDTAFQLWMMTCFTLNFAAAHYLLRRGFGLSVTATCFGAVLLAFGGAQVVHIWHPQLIPMFFVYAAIGALCEIFAERNRARPGARRVAMGGLCSAVALQFYTAFYPLFFFGLFAAVAGLLGVLQRAPRARALEWLKADWAFCVVAAGLTMAAAAPLLSEYLGTADALGLRPYMARFVARPASWLLLGTENFAWGWLQTDAGPFRELAPMEHSAGVGIATALLGAVGLFRMRDRFQLRVLAVAAVGLIALATTVGDFSLWRWVHAWIPGAGAIRVPSRIPMVLAVVTAIGAVAWVDRLSGPRRRALGFAALALCCVEQLRAPFPQMSKEALRTHTAAIAAKVPTHCRAFFLVYDGPAGYVLEDDDAAWVQLATGLPTVNGRYGNNPKHWKLRKHQSNGPQPDPVALRVELRRWLARFDAEPQKVCWVEYGRAG